MKIKSFFQKIWLKVVWFYNNKFKNLLSKVGKFLYKYLGIQYLNKFYRKLSNKTKKAITGYIFIFPFIVGLIVFGFQPIFQSIKMAFSDFSGTKVINGTPQFIINGFSLAQFRQIFQDNPEHVEAILETLLDVAIVVPLVLVFSLILSLLLNTKIKGYKIFRMIFFIPVILLSGNLLGYFERYGLLVVPALKSEDLQATLSFYLPSEFTEIIMSAFNKVVLILWLGGVQTLIFLAGLQKTDKPIYEAASIDGASKWESFWKITFPSLIPLMTINIVYTTVVYSNLGNKLTSAIASSIVAADYGRDYSSALSWILFLIELLVVGFYILVIKIANKRYN